jgi:hypothetical protein
VSPQDYVSLHRDRDHPQLHHHHTPNLDWSRLRSHSCSNRVRGRFRGCQDTCRIRATASSSQHTHKRLSIFHSLITIGLRLHFEISISILPPATSRLQIHRRRPGCLDSPPPLPPTVGSDHRNNKNSQSDWLSQTPLLPLRVDSTLSSTNPNAAPPFT